MTILYQRRRQQQRALIFFIAVVSCLALAVCGLLVFVAVHFLSKVW